ncbi:hypothetical protein HCN44_009711 [Aphidius gifuensis]|uniref:Uncharacterized protein n=1 Tax=Aphidius gifuensis TaxID=684658 RepID=A0A835CYA6_APHGI|nr:hypothetical protein HCN44_009711 [Aphidius gifuensis]
MPAAKRNSGKNGSGRAQQNNTSQQSNHSTNLNDDKKNIDTINGRLLAPKHVPVPQIPVDGLLKFETISLIASIIAASTQFLNLYRTVWWLPNSYNNYAMNFYLIDRYLVVFIITIITWRFIYTLFCKFIEIISHPKWLSNIQKVIRIILLLIVISIISYCIFHMIQDHGVMRIIYLSYPCLSVYMILYGSSLAPFLDPSIVPVYIKEDKKTKLKNLLYSSARCAYICCITPIIFAPKQLYFNIPWVIQHILLFWLGRLCAYFTQIYPVKYCDVLHRASLHLGKWIKVDNNKSNKNLDEQVPSWNETSIWPHGSLVSYKNNLYRSEGLCTTAVPNNTSQKRFHALFNNPAIIMLTFLSIQFIIMIYEFLTLFRQISLYQTISITMLFLINLNSLYKLLRDYIICYKIYGAEKIVQERAQAAINTSQ